MCDDIISISVVGEVCDDIISISVVGEVCVMI